MGVDLFPQGASDRTMGNGLQLNQGRFRLFIMKPFFKESSVKHWNGLPREAMASLSLEVFKKWLDLLLRFS